MLEFPSYGWSDGINEEIDEKILSIKNLKKRKGVVSHHRGAYLLFIAIMIKKEFNIN